MTNVRIAILDAYDHACTFLDNAVSGAMHYYNDELHTYLSGSAYTFSFCVSTNHDDVQFLIVGNKLSYVFSGKGYYCNIVSVEQTQEKIKATAYGLSFELTSEETGAYKASNAMSFMEYISAFNFEKQVFEIGINEVSDKKLTYEWTGTETILARLFSLASVFGAELEFVTEVAGDYSLNRIVVNVYKEHDINNQGIGTDHRSDIIRYGRGIKSISKTSDITEIYTAIRPIGKDGLTLADIDKVEYDSEGNVEYSSLSGTTEILAPQARDRYPSTLMADVNGRYIAKVWSYETDDLEVLYGQSLAQLKKNCVPQVSYDVDGYVEANIGDTFTIEDSEYKPILYLEARITEQKICFTDRTRCRTVFDNFSVVKSSLNDDLLKQMNSMIEANKDDIISSIEKTGVTYAYNNKKITLGAHEVTLCDLKFSNSYGNVPSGALGISGYYTPSDDSDVADVSMRFMADNQTLPYVPLQHLTTPGKYVIYAPLVLYMLTNGDHYFQAFASITSGSFVIDPEQFTLHLLTIGNGGNIESPDTHLAAVFDPVALQSISMSNIGIGGLHTSVSSEFIVPDQFTLRDSLSVDLAPINVEIEIVPMNSFVNQKRVIFADTVKFDNDNKHRFIYDERFVSLKSDMTLNTVYENAASTILQIDSGNLSEIAIEIDAFKDIVTWEVRIDG